MGIKNSGKSYTRDILTEIYRLSGMKSFRDDLIDRMKTGWGRFVLASLFCQRGKVHKHVHLQPAEIPVPHRRFAHIHVDLVGPLPPSRGHTYLLTVIDRTSRWPEAIPLPSITTADAAKLGSTPSTLAEELLLARFVLVRRDGAQPPLSPVYDGPYRVLERSTHFFLLQIGERRSQMQGGKKWIFRMI